MMMQLNMQKLESSYHSLQRTNRRDEAEGNTSNDENSSVEREKDVRLVIGTVRREVGSLIHVIWIKLPRGHWVRFKLRS
jgi:hypothetical protein